MFKFLFTILSMFMFFYFLIVPGWMANYSDGQRTGDIYKFSKKGIFYKSWEGEMYLGGYHSTGGKQATIETDKFYFSIPADDANADLIADIQNCASTREQCTIYYREWLKAPINVDTSYIAVDVFEKQIQK